MKRRKFLSIGTAAAMFGFLGHRLNIFGLLFKRPLDESSLIVVTRFRSKLFPDKKFSSPDDFWENHGELTCRSKETRLYTSMVETLSEDQKEVTLTKSYASKELYRRHLKRMMTFEDISENSDRLYTIQKKFIRSA